GRRAGGFCWYIGASGQNCSSVCQPHGGYSEATRTYAGSDGTTDQCQDVIAQYYDNSRIRASDGYVCFGRGAGCIIIDVTDIVAFRCIPDRTTAVAFPPASFYKRACACNR